MVNGVLYSTAGTRRSVVALNAASGELLWMHSENEGPRGQAAPRQLSGRGLAYWTDGKQERILYVTPGYRLIALDAKTGAPVVGFGQGGIVDLKLENDQQTDLVTGEVGLHAAPVVAKDIVKSAAAHLPAARPRAGATKKDSSAPMTPGREASVDLPHDSEPGEYGNETWRTIRGRTPAYRVWGQITVDEELVWCTSGEIPRATTTAATAGRQPVWLDLVALDSRRTAEWHYQLIHHDIWTGTFRVPRSSPTSRSTAGDQGGAQARSRAGYTSSIGSPVSRCGPSKSGGGAVYRALEKSSRTQRFVTKPPAFDRQGVSLDDLIDFTPELKARGRSWPRGTSSVRSSLPQL